MAKHHKNQIRDFLSVEAARTANHALHLLGKQGTTLPGKIALSISSTILEDLAGGIRRRIFAVCGTNGKTTVNNLLCAALEESGCSVVCNRLGANMQNGIAAAFALAADPFGSLSADYACLEVDEAAAAVVFPYVRPDILILTNLFRDQLDRYGEIDIIMDKLENAIRSVPEMKLIVDADDPLSVYLAKKSGHPYSTYGISEKVHEEGTDREGEIREGRFCKKCGALLHYDFYQYSQIGIWQCPACSFSRPDPDYEASGITFDHGIRFKIGENAFHTDMTGLYSVYNILAVYSALSEDKREDQETTKERGDEKEQQKAAKERETTKEPGPTKETTATGEETAALLQSALSHYHPQFGRGEHFLIDGKQVILNLAKNPAGFNQNIAAVLEDKEDKDLIIAINDNDQDGNDISWLWDVDFDLLGRPEIQSITVGGIRALDLSLRFKYVDIRTEVTEDLHKAITEKLSAGCGKLYVLVNYTALFDIHQELKKMETERGTGDGSQSYLFC